MDLNSPNLEQNTPANNPMDEYEQLKQKNKRRLIGAGALTLLVGGFFAIITNNAPKNMSNSADAHPVIEQPTSVKPQTEVLYPNGVKATRASAEVPATGLSEEEMAINPDEDSPQKKTSPTVTPSIQNLPNTSRSLNQHNIAPTTNNHSTKTQRAQSATQDRHRKAQVITARAEAEREARRKMAAEKARQAQIAANNARKVEREKLISQTMQRNKTHVSSKTGTVRAQTPPTNSPKSTIKGGKIMVQAGVFRNKTLAVRAQQTIQNLGYLAQIEEVHLNKNKAYRVRTGGFTTRSAAEQAASKMKARGLGGMIVE